MSYRRDKRTGYSITTREVWFDFNGPEYLFGKCVVKEAIDGYNLFFWHYLN